MILTLNLANLLIGTIFGEARNRGAAPLAAVVLDTGGHLVSAQREDGAGFLRTDIARAKAWGALGMGFGTREMFERAKTMPGFINAIAATSQGQIIPSPGGIILLDAEETILGAVGLSGDTGDVDEACALAAIGTSGLRGREGA